MSTNTRMSRPIAAIVALVTLAATLVTVAGPASAAISFSPQPNVVTQFGAAIATVDIDATGAGPITYASTTLPPGLAINSTNGEITGTPTAAGNFAVTVTATDTDGPVGLAFAWSVPPVRVGAGKFGVGSFGLGHSSHAATRAFLENPANFGPGGTVTGIGGIEVIASVTTITQAYLDGIDILFDGWVWEGAGVDTYSAAELTLIDDWVTAGGVLIINDDDGDDTVTHVGSADALANRFGEAIASSIIPLDEVPPQADRVGVPVAGQAGHDFFTGSFGAVASIEGHGTTGNYGPAPLSGGFVALVEDDDTADILVGELLQGSGYVVLSGDEGFFREFATAQNGAFVGNVFESLVAFVGPTSLEALVGISVTTPAAQASSGGTQITPVAVVATSHTIPAQSINYMATGLPAGLQLNSATGQITGTPSNPTASPVVSNVTVTVTDGVGHSAATSGFSWTVSPNGPDPDPDPGSAVIAVGVPGEDIGAKADGGVVDVIPTQIDGTPNPAAAFELRQGKGVVGGKSEAGDRFGASVLTADFDGNGFDDVVVGSPNEDVGRRDSAGMVQVIYMGAQGPLRSKSFHQRTPGIPGKAEAGDRFGHSLASMDYDGDGNLDLVVGVPFEDVGPLADAGGFHILFGSPTGIVATGSRWFDQNSGGIDDSAEAGDLFGYAVGGDGRLLAVGAPEEDVTGNSDAGLVQVIDRAGSNWSFRQGTGFDVGTNNPGVGGALEPGDMLGSAVAVSGQTIAAGAPGENWETADAGGVNIVDNLTRTGVMVGQALAGVSGKAETSDGFGAALAAFTPNAQNPVVLVGVPGEDHGKKQDTGMVHAISFNAATLAISEVANLHQSATGIPGKNEAGDRFGAAVAVDPSGSYIIGAPGEAIGSTSGAGAITHLGTHASLIHQGTVGVPGKVEADDGFGGVVG